MFRTKDRVTMPMPDDFHAHLRQGEGLSAYVRGHAGQFGRVLLMPNTLPPVSGVPQLEAYRAESNGLSGLSLRTNASSLSSALRFFPE